MTLTGEPMRAWKLVAGAGFEPTTSGLSDYSRAYQELSVDILVFTRPQGSLGIIQNHS